MEGPWVQLWIDATIHACTHVPCSLGVRPNKALNPKHLPAIAFAGPTSRDFAQIKDKTFR